MIRAIVSLIRAFVSLIRAIVEKLRETRDSLALLTRFQRVSRSFYTIARINDTIARINDTTARIIGWRNPLSCLSASMCDLILQSRILYYLGKITDFLPKCFFDGHPKGYPCESTVRFPCIERDVLA